jgi:hypothetical protein
MLWQDSGKHAAIKHQRKGGGALQVEEVSLTGQARLTPGSLLLYSEAVYSINGASPLHPWLLFS